MIVICRVSFCPRCRKEERPKTDQKCVFYGSKRGSYFVRGARHIGRFGFTPHLLRLVKIVGDNVVYEQICGMNECGADIWWSSNEMVVKFILRKHEWRRGIITRKQWNAWLEYKHDPDYDI